MWPDSKLRNKIDQTEKTRDSYKNKFHPQQHNHSTFEHLYDKLTRPNNRY